MNELSIVFMGVIALGALVQAVFLAAALVGLSRATRRFEELADQVEREWPALRERIATLSEEVVSLSQSARTMAARTESVAQRVATTAEHAGGLMRAVAEWPVTPLGRVAAVLRAVRRGLEVYRRIQASRA